MTSSRRPSFLVPNKRYQKRTFGLFEFRVMQAIDELPAKERYGLKIWEHVCSQINDVADLAQCYVALKRLKSRGDVKDEERKLSARQKRAAILYSITKQGADRLSASRELYK